MTIIRRLLTVLLTLFLSLGFVSVAFAHPLGNFTINHYAGLYVSRTGVSIDYVLDMAEIPAFQEIATFDVNKNGRADPSESGAYHGTKCITLQEDLSLLLNKKSVPLTLISSSVEFPAGAGGLPTLRLTCGFHASIDDIEQLTGISFTDNSYSERLGWREIVVIADGVLLNGDFASNSLSNRLTSYPEDLLASPLDQREIRLGVGSLTVSQKNDPAEAAQQIPPVTGNRGDVFTRLITLQDLTPYTVLFALLIAFVWGAMHAMTPGHGKTIVGAYLIGSRGTLKHALYLGLTTTITHTLGVFALGLITLFAAQYILPETLYPWMSLLSGLFVVGIGLNLFLERVPSPGLGTWFHKIKEKRVLSPKNFNRLTFARNGGVSVAHQHRYVLHSHSHDPHKGIHPHGEHHLHDHDHDHVDHSHMPPESITWRNLLALGISGGLLPCPSALVVMLGAIALNKIGFGLILVLSFSLGLAAALTVIGVLFIYAGKLFQKFPSSGKVMEFIPAASALVVSVIGVGIMVKALAEMGIV